jgi:hypothetical protein
VKSFLYVLKKLSFLLDRIDMAQYMAKSQGKRAVFRKEIIWFLFSSVNTLFHCRVFQLFSFFPIKRFVSCRTLVAHTCNPSYSGGRDQEDCGSQASLGKYSSRDPISKIPITEEGWWNDSRCRP